MTNPRLVGAKFTSVVEFMGWRHFHVGAVRRSARGLEAELIASVDRSVRTWISAGALADRRAWSPGWQSLQTRVVSGR